MDAACEHRDWVAASLGAPFRTLDLAKDGGLLDSAAILVMSGWGARGTAQARLVREIRDLNPGLIILVTTDDPGALDWRSLARAGVDDAVVTGGATLARSFSRLVADHLAAPVHEIAAQDVLALRPTGFGSRFVWWCLRNAIGPRTVLSMSEWFQVSERSMRRHLDKSGLPGASLIWRFGRILRAERLRELRLCTQEEAARRVGYADAAALRSARRALRAKVAADDTVRQFVAPIRDLVWLLPEEVDNLDGMPG